MSPAARPASRFARTWPEDCKFTENEIWCTDSIPHVKRWDQRPVYTSHTAITRYVIDVHNDLPAVCKIVYKRAARGNRRLKETELVGLNWEQVTSEEAAREKILKGLPPAHAIEVTLNCPQETAEQQQQPENENALRPGWYDVLLSMTLTECALVRVAKTEEGRKFEGRLGVDFDLYLLNPVCAMFRTVLSSVAAVEPANKLLQSQQPFVVDYESDLQTALGPVTVALDFKLYVRSDPPTSFGRDRTGWQLVLQKSYTKPDEEEEESSENLPPPPPTEPPPDSPVQSDKLAEDATWSETSDFPWEAFADSDPIDRPNAPLIVNLYAGREMPGLVYALREFLHSPRQRGRVLLGPLFGPGPFDLVSFESVDKMLEFEEVDVKKWQRFEGKYVLFDEITIVAVKCRDPVQWLAEDQQIQESVWWKNLGNEQYARKRYRNAFQLYRRAAEIVDDQEAPLESQRLLATLYSNSAQCCIMQEQWKSALVLLNSIWERYPNSMDAKAFYRKALVCHNIARTDEALTNINRALALNGADRAIRKLKAEIVAAAKKGTKALRADSRLDVLVERSEEEQIRSDILAQQRKLEVVGGYLDYCDREPFELEQQREYDRVWRGDSP